MHQARLPALRIIRPAGLVHRRRSRLTSNVSRHTEKISLKGKSMLRCSFAILLVVFAAPLYAKGFTDKSSLSTPDMALCTAAAMKSGQGFDLYKKWVGALDARYKIIYPNLSAKEIDSYTAERVLDKKMAFNRKGIETAPAFKNFYANNCSSATP